MRKLSNWHHLCVGLLFVLQVQTLPLTFAALVSLD